MNDKLEMNLFENAIDSLEMALKNYEKSNRAKAKYLKHVLLNLSMFIELSLKYFITKIHPDLIFLDFYCLAKKEGVFKNSFDCDRLICSLEKIKKSSEFSTEKTITMDQAKEIIKKTHEKDNEYNEKISWIVKEANAVKHYKVDLEEKKFIIEMGKILYKLDFLYDQYEISVIENLDVRLAKLYNVVIDECKHFEKFCEEKAKKFKQITKDDVPLVSYDDALIMCPNCQKNSMLLNEASSQYKCEYCDASDIAVVCNCCNKTFPCCEKYEEIAEEVFFCSEQCYQTMFNRYSGRD